MLLPSWLPPALGLLLIVITLFPALLRWLSDRASAGKEESYPGSDKQIAFHQAEFSALKVEVAELVKSTASNFQYAAVGSAAVVTWIATGHDKMNSDVLRTGLWLPFLLASLLVSMSAAQYIRIGDIAAYLLRLENALGSKDLGWEKTFRTRPRTVGLIYLLGWITLFAMDFLVGALGVGA
jgi:hypothetical protein